MATECLLDSIRACRICAPVLPVVPRPVLQFHRSARILIASQAPGRIVYEIGIPFNDRSGDRLREWMGVKREQFYDERLFAIAPMGFCFPGAGKSGDLPPRRECARRWRLRLFDQLPQIELMVLVGGYAQRWHLGRSAGSSVTETVRAWRNILERPGPCRCLPVPHPSWRNNGWLKANPWFEVELLPCLRREVRHLLGSEPSSGRVL